MPLHINQNGCKTITKKKKPETNKQKYCQYQDAEQQKHSLIFYGNAKWDDDFGKEFGKFINIHLPDDPAVALLGIFQCELKIYVQQKCVQKCSQQLFS